MFESAQQIGKVRSPQLLDLARQKLVYHQDIRPTPEDGTELVTSEAAAAVLDVLVKLDFGQTRSEVTKQSKLVSRHMRLAHSIPQYRHYAYTGYSSEPVLAEAAAHQLYVWMTAPEGYQKFNLADILDANIDAGTPAILDHGQRGEVVTRILIMTAYIRAVAEENQSEPDGTNPFFTKGCSLATFMEELFTKDYSEVVLDSSPSGRPPTRSTSQVIPDPPTLRTTFKNSVVRITHFVRAGDNSSMTLPVMKAAFIRGMAFIGHPTQDYVDLMIPVLIDKNKPITDDNMTAIMWQVKRRLKSSARNAVNFDADQIYFFPKGTAEEKIAEKPYIVLISELGLFKKNYDYVQLHAKAVGAKGVLEQPSRPSTRMTGLGASPAKISLGSSPKKHPLKYTIFAYGCSPTIYKVIGERERQKYQKLLAIKPPFYDHPRQYTMRAVHAFKPLWFLAKSYYDWIQGPYYPQSNAEQLNENEVSVDDGMVVTGADAVESISQVLDQATRVYDTRPDTDADIDAGHGVDVNMSDPPSSPSPRM